MNRSKENGRGGQRGRGDKKKGSPKCYSWELNQMMEEMRALEMKLFIHESDEAFRMPTKEVRPEDPDCEKAETK